MNIDKILYPTDGTYANKKERESEEAKEPGPQGFVHTGACIITMTLTVIFAVFIVNRQFLQPNRKST